MGRELKRVPLNFDWPLNERWKGYLNPYGEHCCPEKDKNCLNGSTPGRAWFESIVRLLFIAADDAAYAESGRDTGRIWPHPYLQNLETAPHTSGEYDRNTKRWTVRPKLALPTKELLELTEGLCGRRGDRSPLGHDSSDTWHAFKKIIEAAGLDEDWGTCPVCKGTCIDPEYSERFDSWEREDPPEGPGFQLWETTSEGSPVSPVFETLEKLCEWCADNATTFGSFKATKEEWMKMLDDGFVAHREGSMIFL